MTQRPRVKLFVRPKPDCLVGTEFTTRPQPKRQQTPRHFPFEGHGCAEDAGGSAAGKNRGLQCAQSYKRLGNDVSKHKRAIKTLEDFVEMERKTGSTPSWMSPLELHLGYYVLFILFYKQALFDETYSIQKSSPNSTPKLIWERQCISLVLCSTCRRCMDMPLICRER